MRVLLTGAAGFIGFHVAQRLLSRGDAVAGFDNLNDYYDVSLKEARLSRLLGNNGFTFTRADLVDLPALSELFDSFKPDRVVHLAAQAGVRYSLSNPHAYAQSNLVGFLNVLEACRHGQVEHLVYASSSSVYGSNTKIPYSTRDPVDHPRSLYAATKKANELMAHSYSHLFGLPTTGLRFFTVYGPWGRPDMALFIFTKAILEGRPIDVFNHGQMSRDFTYIDDIAEGVLRVLDRPPCRPSRSGSAAGSASQAAPQRVYNIGNNQPVKLTRLIECLENTLGRKAEKILLPMHAGDVPDTFADIDELAQDVGFKPSTPVELGVQRFIDWYRSYYPQEPAERV